MNEDRSTKGFWIIFAMILILVPLFMFSHETKIKRDKKSKEEIVSHEENRTELIPVEEDEMMPILEEEMMIMILFIPVRLNSGCI